MEMLLPYNILLPYYIPTIYFSTVISFFYYAILRGSIAMKRFTFFIIFMLAVASYSQVEKSYFSIIGSFSTPLGEFKEGDLFDEDGFSLGGFSGGVQYTLPLWNQYVALLAEASLLINFFDREEAEDEFVYFVTNEPDGGSYFNIPILIGLKLTIPIVSLLKFYATGQVGFNIMNESDMDAEVGPDRQVSLEFAPDVTLALGAGGGIIIAEQLILGVRFLSLGEPEFDLEGSFSNPSVDFDGERKFKMYVFQFMIGYDF